MDDSKSLVARCVCVVCMCVIGLWGEERDGSKGLSVLCALLLLLWQSPPPPAAAAVVLFFSVFLHTHTTTTHTHNILLQATDIVPPSHLHLTHTHTHTHGYRRSLMMPPSRPFLLLLCPLHSLLLFATTTTAAPPTLASSASSPPPPSSLLLNQEVLVIVNLVAKQELKQQQHRLDLCFTCSSSSATLMHNATLPFLPSPPRPSAWTFTVDRHHLQRLQPCHVIASMHTDESTPPRRQLMMSSVNVPFSGIGPLSLPLAPFFSYTHLHTHTHPPPSTNTKQ